MKINDLDLIEGFIKQQPDSATALQRWVAITSSARWANFTQVKEFFRSADYIAPYTIFDIGGNKWRLITVIDYGLELVVVMYVLTHKEYDAEKWKK